MKPHANLAFFIPHLGCPHRCSFCDQQTISGSAHAPSPEEVAQQCAAVFTGGNVSHMEIAFFGGSFTAIPKAQMCAYLEGVQPFLGENGFSGIRISTRPDAVSEETLELLKAYHVTAIELGAQSLSDAVLAQNERGHTAQAVREAAMRIRRHGFSLGLQMMVGLYGSTLSTERETVDGIVALAPDTVRIYPTVVVEGTRLATLFRSGVYQLPSWEEMLSFLEEALCRFHEAGIAVIRCGLHAEEGLRTRMVAGFYHPALRELVESRLFLRCIQAWLSAHAQEISMEVHPVLQIETAPEDIGKASGHRRCNRLAVQAQFPRLRLQFRETSTQPAGQMRLFLWKNLPQGDRIRIGEEVYDVFKITGAARL